MTTRTFHFKVYDLKNKKLIPTQEFRETPYVFIDNPNFLVLQSTGFKDIHGQEIFEGDSVIQRNSSNEVLGTGVIKWLWAGFWFYNNKTGACLPPCSQNTNLEIIGNIYNGKD